MDTKEENDKETIRGESFEKEKRRHEKRDKKKKHRSRDRSNSDRHTRKKKSSTDSKSSRDRKRNHDRHRGKHYKDKDRRQSIDSRDKHSTKRKSRDIRDRDRSKERKSNDKYTSNKYSSKSREKSPTNIDIKKKIDDISKQGNQQAPISTTDIMTRNKEVYVSNFPEGLTSIEVIELMNAAMIAMEANIKSGNPIVGAWICSEQNCAFLEMRTPEEAINSFKLDGMSLLGKEIKIGKPRYQDEANTSSKDMFPTLTLFERDLSNPYLNRGMAQSSLSKSSLLSSSSTTSSKLLVSNMPISFDEDAIYQVLRTFGKIKYVELIKDPSTGKSSGCCHVEYETETATANALHYIMGMSILNNTLYIRRSTGLAPSYFGSGNSYYGSGSLTSPDDLPKQKELIPSKCICIKNIVTAKDLENDNDYDDLYHDIRDECKTYGKVISLKIPGRKNETSQGLGKIFVEYATRDGAAFAREHLQGKLLKGRKADVVFHPEDLFRRNQFD